MCESRSSARSHELFAAIMKSRSSLGRHRRGLMLGSTSRRVTLDVVDFAVPCSPLKTKIGYGPRGRSAARRNAE